MPECEPTSHEANDESGEDLESESRRDFLRDALGVGAGVAMGTLVPAEEAEGGVLSGGVLKAAAGRAALNSAERRLMSEEDKSKFTNLEKGVVDTRIEYLQKLEAYIKSNPGKVEADYHKTHEGVEYYNKWIYARRAVRDFKK